MSEKAKDMTVSEAWTVINKLGKWNVGQKSISLASCGPRTIEDDIYDLQRAALKTAWEVVARKIDESPEGKAAHDFVADYYRPSQCVNCGQKKNHELHLTEGKAAIEGAAD